MAGCRCDKTIAPEAQELCRECALHQVTTCSECGHRLWWADAVTDETGTPWCDSCDFWRSASCPV
jgi:hypothetical protein